MKTLYAGNGDSAFVYACTAGDAVYILQILVKHDCGDQIRL